MRKITTYKVSGDTMADLETKALAVFRELVDDSSASMPWQATMEVSESSGPGVGRWTGEVTITETEGSK